MKLKRLLFVGITIVILTLLVNVSVSSDHNSLLWTSENLEAFASPGFEIGIPGPDPGGYCRCKDEGCYAGNMISFRANCGIREGVCNPKSNCSPS